MLALTLGILLQAAAPTFIWPTMMCRTDAPDECILVRISTDAAPLGVKRFRFVMELTTNDDVTYQSSADVGAKPLEPPAKRGKKKLSRKDSPTAPPLPRRAS